MWEVKGFDFKTRDMTWNQKHIYNCCEKKKYIWTRITILPWHSAEKDIEVEWGLLVK